MTAVNAADGTLSATATITITDQAVIEAHNQWLDGVAAAAASYGCTNISIQQQESESLPEVIDRFGTAGTEGGCLVLWPISTDPTSLRYSLAWGGTLDGKDILYITDVSQMRIWNGEEVTTN